MQGLLYKVKGSPNMSCYLLHSVKHGSLGFYHAALCELACRAYVPSICRVGFINDRRQLRSAGYNWNGETLTV